MGRPRKKQAFSFPSKEEIAGAESVFPLEGKDLQADVEAKKDAKKAADAVPPIFTPEQVAWCFDAYCAALSFVFSIVLKIDYSLIHDELKFDENEKQALAIPLAKVASKYAPVAWAGMTAEIELITTLGIWSATSFRRAQVIAKREAEKKKEAALNPSHPDKSVRAVTPLRQNLESSAVPL